MLLVAGTVQDSGVGGEHLAQGGARSDRLLAGQQGLVAGSVHGPVLRRGLSDQQGPHHRCVVATFHPAPLQRELVHRVELAPAGDVPDHQRPRSRADDHLVAGVVATTAQYGTLHIGQDPGLGDPDASQVDGYVPGVVG